MFRKRSTRDRDRARGSAAARRLVGGGLARLSYANVTASLALFIALGGTAAAVTLARDSVGPPQIQADAVRSSEVAKDAVRSPEIAADAVRSPEIKADAVRTSEIKDNAIRLADISTGAQDALSGAPGPAGPEGPSGTTDLRIAEAANDTVPECTASDLAFCPNLALLRLPPGSWLVQAKLSLVGFFGFFNNRCGLVQSDTTTIDAVDDLNDGSDFTGEVIALSGVLTTAPNVALTNVALRCNEPTPTDDLTAVGGKLTALKVTTITGP